MFKTKLLLTLSLILITGFGSSVVQAQKYPDRAVKIVVPFAPGGGADLLARTLSRSLAERWGQPVIVENRPGASGNIGAEVVARAEPDGYTLLLTSSAFVIGPGMTSKLPFDVEKDFTPITLAVELPNVLVVHPSIQANSVAELVALIKEKKTEINYASPGSGTGGHLAAELFKQSAGVDVLHIPYKGGGAVIADLLAGRVQMSFATLPSVMSFITAGTLRPLALTTREQGFIDVPTMIESGFVGFDLSTWLGFLGPAGLSPVVVEKLNTDLVFTMKSPQISEQMKKQGMLEVASTQKYFAEKINSDVQMYKTIIDKAGAKLD